MAIDTSDSEYRLHEHIRVVVFRNVSLIAIQTSNRGGRSASEVYVQHLDADNCDLLYSVINSTEDVQWMGVTLHLTESGFIDRIALATSTIIFQVCVSPKPRDFGPESYGYHEASDSTSITAQEEEDRDSSAERPPVHASLAHVLSHPRCRLAGIHMPRLASILSKRFRAHVRGIDLSTIHYDSTSCQLSLAALAQLAFNHEQVKGNVRRLFDEGCDTDICLRAWLSAWHVIDDSIPLLTF